MASFPVSPRFGKMLCLAHQHNLLAYVVAIVSALSVQELFEDLHQPNSSQGQVRACQLQEGLFGKFANQALESYLLVLRCFRKKKVPGKRNCCSSERCGQEL